MGAQLLPATLADRHGRPFTVRRLRPDDRSALEAMYESFQPKWAAQGLPPAGLDRIRRWLARTLATGEHVVVEVDGVLAGHGMLIPIDDERAELANFLHQDWRDRGIGTGLNLLLVALAREQAWRRVWLSVEPGNRAAVRSYEKAGFRKLPGTLWAPEFEMEVVLAEDGD
jgi:RimJ/RimL family protein N-acetyltransferase